MVQGRVSGWGLRDGAVLRRPRHDRGRHYRPERGFSSVLPVDYLMYITTCLLFFVSKGLNPCSNMSKFFYRAQWNTHDNGNTLSASSVLIRSSVTYQKECDAMQVELGIPVPPYWARLMAKTVGEGPAQRLTAQAALLSPQQARRIPECIRTTLDERLSSAGKEYSNI